MDINTTNNLLANGVLKDLYVAGFVNSKIFAYRDIYMWVMNEMVIYTGIKYLSGRQAQLYFSDLFDSGKKTVI